jgi:hypothetical protein
MITRLLVTDAVMRARQLGFIGRANVANTRLWIYTGAEERKSSWREVGGVRIADNGTVDLGDLEQVLGRRPLNPKGWREADGVALPAIAWADIGEGRA